MFDMLTGKPPFVSSSRTKTIEKILHYDVRFPRFLTADACDLIKKLLKKSPDSRLGGGCNDAEPIRQHRFFSGTNWDDVLDKKLEPPFTPSLANEEDVSQFDTKFTQQTPIDSPVENTDFSAINEVFAGFTYVAPSVLDDLHRVGPSHRQQYNSRSPRKHYHHSSNNS